MKKVIIVMPVANEETTMKDLIDEIMSLPYENLHLYPVIDDFSKDNTKKIIIDMEKIYPKLKLIYFEESTGVISCYLEGFRHALKNGAEWVIEMDGGGSHQPDEISRFIEKLKEGYDCVFGSRFLKGGGIQNHPFFRKFLSYYGTALSNFVLGTNFKDMTSGFEAFKSEILEQICFEEFLSTGHMYQTEMRYYCRKLNYVEVPITYIGSQSGLKSQTIFEALSILFKLKMHEKNVTKFKVENII